MCGRFTNQITWRELVELYRIHDQPALNLRPRYNVAPSQDIPIVRPIDDAREIAIARWGLVPFWAKDLKVGYKMINAKAETVNEKPSFRNAFKSRRCLIPADGFYEWVRHEVVCVIVRRSHPAGPAVPSAVPYEVGRVGNEPSKSPRTMYPTVSRRVPELRGTGASASIRWIGARVDGMVSTREPLKYRQE